MILGVDVGIRNFAYCIRDSNKKLFKCVEVIDFFDLEIEEFPRRKRKNSIKQLKSTDIHDYTQILFKHIFTSTFMSKIESVKIESLPHRCNRKVWLLTHLVYSRMQELKNRSLPFLRVSFVHGKKKYDRHLFLLSFYQQLDLRSRSYQIRKQNSVTIFLAVTRHFKICVNALGPKLDDAADAYLLTFVK